MIPFEYHPPHNLQDALTLLEVHLVEHPCASGPLGAKGVGAAPIIPPPAVIANAVAGAIGVRIRELPLTAEKICAALEKTKLS